MLSRQLRVLVGATAGTLLVESRSSFGGTGEALLFTNTTTLALGAEEYAALKRTASKLRDVYALLGVQVVLNGSEALSYLVVVTACAPVGKIMNHEVFRITAVDYICISDPQMQLAPQSSSKRTPHEQQVAELRKFYSTGTFYFAVNGYDLCTPLQCQPPRPGAHAQPAFHLPTSAPCTCDLDGAVSGRDACATGFADDQPFFWNHSLWHEVTRHGICGPQWLVQVMCGTFDMRTTYVSGQQAQLLVVLRRSHLRHLAPTAGDGLDDQGHVSGFAETEQILQLGTRISSFVQVRGSVPVFYEMLGTDKARITRGRKATECAVTRHFEHLHNRYCELHTVHMTSPASSVEEMMMHDYEHHITAWNSSGHPTITQIKHNQFKRGKVEIKDRAVLNSLAQALDTFNVFYQEGHQLISSQSGVVRTSCIDCLERSTACQGELARFALQRQLTLFDIDAVALRTRFETILMEMWKKLAQEIIRCETVQPRPEVLALGFGLLNDSVQETAHLCDVPVSSAFDALSPSSRASVSAFARLIDDHSADFTATHSITVWAGSWSLGGMSAAGMASVGGRTKLRAELAQWLQLGRETAGERPIDLLAVGIEELNEADDLARHVDHSAWVQDLSQAINDAPDPNAAPCSPAYRILTARALGQTRCYIFVLPHLIPHIKSVNICSHNISRIKPLSSSGMGAIAVRLQIYDSSVCFVLSHLTGGLMNVNERNQDVIDILRKVNFGRQLGIPQNNHIIWWGNLNYRLEVPVKHKLETISELVQAREWAVLRDFDQLLSQRALCHVLVGFEEATLAFPPSYKYDPATGAFDAQAVPAWKERVLFHSRTQGSLISKFYGSLPTALGTQHPVAGVLELELVETRDADLDAVRAQVQRNYGTLHTVLVVTPSLPADALEAVLAPLGRIADICSFPSRAIVIMASIEAAHSVLAAADGLATADGLPLRVEALPFGTLAHPLPSAAPPISLIPAVPKRRKKRRQNLLATVSSSTGAETLEPWDSKLWLDNNMTRDDAEALIASVAIDGAFLVRASTSTSKANAYTITFWADSQVHHYRVKREDDGSGRFNVKDILFESLDEIVTSYRSNVLYRGSTLRLPVSLAGQAPFEQAMASGKTREEASLVFFDPEGATAPAHQPEVPLASPPPVPAAPARPPLPMRPPLMPPRPSASKEPATRAPAEDVFSGEEDNEDDELEEEEEDDEGAAAQLEFSSKDSSANSSRSNVFAKLGQAAGNFGSKMSFAFANVRQRVMGLVESEPEWSMDTEPSDHGFAFLRTCATAVELRGLAEEGLYRLPGVASKVRALIATAFERGREVDLLTEEWESRTICSALKSYLRDLPVPLLPFDIHDALVAAMGQTDDSRARADSIKGCLVRLPPLNFSMLQYLMAHLARLASFADDNKMQPANIGVVFGPSLMRSVQDDDLVMRNLSAYNAVVETMVVEFEYIFGRRPLEIPLDGTKLDTALPDAMLSESLLAQARHVHSQPAGAGAGEAHAEGRRDDSHIYDTLAAPQRDSHLIYATLEEITAEYANVPATLAEEGEDDAANKEMPIYAQPIPKSQRRRVQQAEVSSPTTADASDVGDASAYDGPTAVVQYAYTAAEDDELTLEEGQIICNIEETDNEGWYFGTLLETGETGLFPDNYVVFHNGSRA